MGFTGEHMLKKYGNSFPSLGMFLPVSCIILCYAECHLKSDPLCDFQEVVVINLAKYQARKPNSDTFVSNIATEDF